MLVLLFALWGQASDWNSIKSTQVVTFHVPDWKVARRLPSPINTEGWEDSLAVARDGTLLFTYSQYDLLYYFFNKGTRISGPPRDGMSATPFDADLFVGQPQADGSYVVSRMPNPPNSANNMEGCGCLDGNDLYFHNSPLTVGGRPKGIYLSRQRNGVWSTPSPLTDTADADNPFMDEYGAFWFCRAGDIWVRGNGLPPFKLIAPTNTPNGKEDQPFRVGNTLYYSRDSGGGSEIWRTDLRLNRAEKVASGYVGEPNVVNGRLFFVKIYVVVLPGIDGTPLIYGDADIMVAEPATP